MKRRLIKDLWRNDVFSFTGQIWYRVVNIDHDGDWYQIEYEPTSQWSTWDRPTYETSKRSTDHVYVK